MAQRKKSVIEQELEVLEALKAEYKAQLLLLREARIGQVSLAKASMSRKERMTDTWRKARAFEKLERIRPQEAEELLNGQ